jgi:hypothetical protein
MTYVATLLKTLFKVLLSKTMAFWAAEYITDKTKVTFDNELVDLVKAIDAGNHDLIIEEAQELIKAVEYDYKASKTA